MNQHPETRPDIDISGRDVRTAMTAIALVDPQLVDFTTSITEQVSLTPDVTRQVSRAPGVVLRGDYQYADQPDVYGDGRGDTLSVLPTAQPALREGLEKFAQGPDKEDYTHLRVGKVLGAMLRQRAAKRILPILDEASSPRPNLRLV